MREIPLQAVPVQSIKTVLGDQNCELLISQKPQGVFVDITANDVSIVASVIARDAVQLVCREYAGFVGNLMFIDTQGSDDPYYLGMGSRFSLVYLTEAEYALIRQ